MSDSKERPGRDAEKGTFTLDKTYFREQAKEAFTTFIAPFSGVISAISGSSFTGKSISASTIEVERTQAGKVLRGPKPLSPSKARYLRSRKKTPHRAA